MRRVEIVASCDAHLAWKGAEVTDGVETVRVLDGHTLDLCLDHREGMRAVLALIAEHAAPVEAATGKRTRRGGKRERARREAAAAEVEVVAGLACPVCGHVAPTSAAIAEHLTRRHGLTSEAVYGLSCPLCGYAGSTPSALGAHGRRIHEIGDGVAGLFMRATADGDPLGIVAARAAALAEIASG